MVICGLFFSAMASACASVRGVDAPPSAVCAATGGDEEFPGACAFAKVPTVVRRTASESPARITTAPPGSALDALHESVDRQPERDRRSRLQKPVNRR